MKSLKIQTFENSSILLKFHILFVILTITPLGVLMYLYFQLHDTGQMDITVNDFNTTLIFVVIGIAAGYVAMRMLLKNVIDITNTTTDRLKEVLGPDRIQEFLKGDENEIAILTRTFSEITNRLEENVQNLEMTKKTLQSVMTRVGQGISNLRNMDTFFDLIVETVTEALVGKKGFLLLVDEATHTLYVKTVYGMSSKPFDKKAFSVTTSPFAPVLATRTALIIPKIQYLDPAKGSEEVFDYPMICAPLVLRDQVLGVIAVSGRKIGNGFQEEEMALLMNLATQTAVAIENSKLSQNADKTYFETLAALAMAVEAKDPYSRGHLERVGSYAVKIAQHMGLEPVDVSHLRDAARLHDVGKIGVTDDVLAKPAPLTDQEWAMMKRHPEIGEGILKPITSLQPLCDLVRHHHEKLDGSGYPDGLKGDQISVPARILCVADIYDALVTDRPYRKALAHEEAVATLRGMAGRIDQQVVDALASSVHP